MIVSVPKNFPKEEYKEYSGLLGRVTPLISVQVLPY